MVTVEVSRERPSLRQAQLAATRERLLDATMEVIEQGGEPTMRAIAKHAGVGERTIYRYFATRDELEQAVGGRLHGRTGAAPPTSLDDFEPYVERLFGAFAANRELLAVLVSAKWAQDVFPRTRRRNLAAFVDVLAEAFPDVDADECRAVAASMRISLSGAGWMYLSDCGFTDEETIAHGKWVVRQAIDTLTRAQRRARRKARP